MDVHKERLVKLANFVKRLHFLLHVLFEGVLLDFFLGRLVLDILGPDFTFLPPEFSFKENKFGFSLIWLFGNFDLDFIQKVITILEMEIVIAII